MNYSFFKFISSSRVYIYLDYLSIYFQTKTISSLDSNCGIYHFVEYNNEHSKIKWGNIYFKVKLYRNIALTQDVANKF